MSWTNEKSDKAIYELMERAGMLQNMTLKCELKQFENSICQALKPEWGGPNDPAVLKLVSEKLQQRLTAADQRADELTQALERGKMWIGQFRAWYGDSGVVAEDHLMIIRTLRGLPPPPSEFDKPTESGASDKCASDGGTCGLGGHCNKCPHTELDPKIIGIERMPPMECDEP